MGEIVLHKIFHRASIALVRKHGYGRRRADKIFHGAGIAVVGLHGYVRGQRP